MRIRGKQTGPALPRRRLSPAGADGVRDVLAARPLRGDARTGLRVPFDRRSLSERREGEGGGRSVLVAVNDEPGPGLSDVVQPGLVVPFALAAEGGALARCRSRCRLPWSRRWPNSTSGRSRRVSRGRRDQRRSPPRPAVAPFVSGIGCGQLGRICQGRVHPRGHGLGAAIDPRQPQYPGLPMGAGAQIPASDQRQTSRVGGPAR